MSEPDIFYVLGNKVRRDLLSHLTCSECYFSFLSSKVSVSSTAVAKHLKIMEREGILEPYEKDEHFIGPARKYYRINIANTYVTTITPNLFWYENIDLREGGKKGDYEINLSKLPEEHGDIISMVKAFLEANDELKKILEALRDVEAYRDGLTKLLKERYLSEIGDMTQLAILHYLLINGEATVDELSDRLNMKEREVLAKAQELNRFVPLKIKGEVIEIDRASL
ncbi:sulfur metabolism transcriptional regulator SurR [Palaeococcus ferrophilus]|uniref:sulfur metabolism transcriptional regulator SurR n=1 Tax=Palaeococcus ferrophilus TaxID=83868 RepID=UPI00064EAC84|nr:helix-turn-helix domain-containing protein [Palaeococcus ferrophilus]